MLPPLLPGVDDDLGVAGGAEGVPQPAQLSAELDVVEDLPVEGDPDAPSSLQSGWAPPAVSMIASRVWPRAAGRHEGAATVGPAVASRPIIRVTRSGSACAVGDDPPQMPHIRWARSGREQLAHTLGGAEEVGVDLVVGQHDPEDVLEEDRGPQRREIRVGPGGRLLYLLQHGGIWSDRMNITSAIGRDARSVGAAGSSPGWRARDS